MDELETLFPGKLLFKLRGKDYEIGKISVSQMTVANSLAQTAYSAVSIDGDMTEIDAASMAVDAIMALLDDGENQAKLEKLIKELTEIDGRLFRHLEITEVVDLITSIVRHNKDFFVLRLTKALRTSMVNPIVK